ncbi:hypothetical protein FisN_8Lh008 [Fistulifera solaris]|uniref:Uncharacterized protein n=1 Tax=Fistulifera solaris TaxID=1519565 RepID=A0A1Z5JDT1_FISSO|nr:hypothetical protein FisN_8Lh008 [Fistulifera solaris]|eukprot:GAX11921.1 hypothetical protein FisN_8Lh008 [Fistulifera solaris]
MTSFNIFALMTTLFALSMGQSYGVDSNLFGGRENQFLCFGRNSDIVKLNDGEPKSGILAANLFRRYSFYVQESLSKAECTTTGSGDIDLFVCEDPDGEECIQNPQHESRNPKSSSETVFTAGGKRTWYIIVKAQPEVSEYTITCNEVPLF